MTLFPLLLHPGIERSQHVYSFTEMWKAAPGGREAIIPLDATSLRTAPMSLGYCTAVGEIPGSQPVQRPVRSMRAPDPGHACRSNRV